MNQYYTSEDHFMSFLEEEQRARYNMFLNLEDEPNVCVGHAHEYVKIASTRLDQDNPVSVYHQDNCLFLKDYIVFVDSTG